MHQDLRIVTPIEVFKDWKWTAEYLLEVLIDFDYETIARLTPNAEVDSRQWVPIFANNLDTWRLLVDDADLVVGYWHFVALTPEYAERCKVGELIEAEFSANNIRPMDKPGVYDIYMVSVCLAPKYQRTGVSDAMMKSFVDVIDELAVKGVAVRNVYTNAYSEKGKRHIQKQGYEIVADHGEHGQIAVSTIEKIRKSCVNSPINLLK